MARIVVNKKLLISDLLSGLNIISMAGTTKQSSQ